MITSLDGFEQWLKIDGFLNEISLFNAAMRELGVAMYQS